MRKWCIAAAVMLSLAAVASLLLPLYSTTLTDGEACTVMVRGYNVVEFSPWGGVVVLAPLALLGILLSKLKSDVKTVGMIGLLLLDGIALCDSVAAARAWIGGIATGFLEPHMGHLLYVLFFLGAAVCFWISTNILSTVTTDRPVSSYNLANKSAYEQIETRYNCSKGA